MPLNTDGHGSFDVQVVGRWVSRSRGYRSNGGQLSHDPRAKVGGPDQRQLEPIDQLVAPNRGTTNCRLVSPSLVR